jgi:hypothetical protein
MSDDRLTRFKLDLPGFELEITGEQRCVEDLYRQISQDLIPLVQPRAPGPDGLEDTAVIRAHTGYTWVYGVTDYYSKVYAVADAELAAGLLGSHIQPSRLRRIYVARDDDDLFTKLAGEQKTLWAEFTPAGRARFQRL